MPEAPARSASTRIDPQLAWSVTTEAPLRGIALAREGGCLLAWDDADHLYLVDDRGEYQSVSRAPGKIRSAAASDIGATFALIGVDGRLWIFGPDLELQVERQVVAEPQSVAIDPHGRYVAVASKSERTVLYTCHGKPAGQLETIQPLVHMRFLPDRPLLIGAAAYGGLYCLELIASSPTRIRGELVWKQSLLSSIGRLGVAGDGSMVLASCFTHGIQRYDLKGHNEGAYHLGGTATMAMPDYVGRVIATATQEGELAILNRSGNVRWKTGLPHTIVGLEVDALGRYLIVGEETGKITRLDLDPSARSSGSSSSPARRAVSAVGPVREPAWLVGVASSEEQAETLDVAVLDDPPRIAVMNAQNRVQLLGADGKSLGLTPAVNGFGRSLKTSPGWVGAATDRQVLLCDARRKTAQALDLSLHELTHVVIRPDGYGVATVQERDRIGRATAAGRWVWKHELRVGVEEIAVGPQLHTAVTTDDGKLTIYDPAGEIRGEFQATPAEPLGLLDSPAGGAPGQAWITLARQRQFLRGHDLDGQVLWETSVPWEAWQVLTVGDVIVVTAPDQRCVVYGPRGALIEESRGGSPPCIYLPLGNRQVARVFRQDNHLVCAQLSGRVIWRTLTPTNRGPIAAGRTGVAAILGKNVAWFPLTQSS